MSDDPQTSSSEHKRRVAIVPHTHWDREWPSARYDLGLQLGKRI